MKKLEYEKRLKEFLLKRSEEAKKQSSTNLKDLSKEMYAHYSKIKVSNKS